MKFEHTDKNIIEKCEAILLRVVNINDIYYSNDRFSAGIISTMSDPPYRKKAKGIYVFVDAIRYSTNKNDAVLCVYICNELLKLDKRDIFNKQFKIENTQINKLNYLHVCEIGIGESVLEQM